jgi:beta-lactamase regulating signal transducer with metallopeptidase domain
MNPNAMTASPVWTAAGWTMLHLLWVGATIGLAAASLRRLARSARPELRYAIALLGLGTLAVAPVMIFVWVFEPAEVPAPPTVSTVASESTARSVAAASILELHPPEPRDSPDRPADSYRRSILSRLDGLAVRLPWLWLAGAPLNLVLLVTGLVGVERIRRSSRVVEYGGIPRRCRALADSLGIARRVGVAVCDRIAAPILIGVIRPLILLPPAAIVGWSVEQLEMVLLHELAHLKRWDNLVNLLQRFVESLLFFHPVAWWLSGWVRLERELCCDRLVVARMGRPEAYVELLVALAGAHRGRRSAVPVLAMADRQITTRIRRILNMEDRSMKLTMPEGVGLVGAMLVGVSLVLGTQAGPPKPAGTTQESLRLALQKAAADAISYTGQDAERSGMKLMALISIGEAQLGLGERTTALETFGRVSEECERFDFKKNDWGDLEIFAILPEVAKLQREAGDLVAARKSLDRATRLVDSLEGFSKVQQLYMVNDRDEARREDHEVGPLVCCELLVGIARERIALGDRDQARALLLRSVAAIQAQKDVLKVMALAGLGTDLFKAGDPAHARAIIDQARRAALELAGPDARDGAMALIAGSLTKIGELDGALELTRGLGKYGKSVSLRDIITSLADEHFPDDWFGPIKLTIGAEPLQLKDRASARRELPKIAQFVRGIPDPLLQARSLSTIAHLQAKSGELSAARQTVDAIPEVRRKDFPGLRDGFYDAIKPATLAIVARLQADAGDRAAATEGLNRATALARSIEAADQRIVAQIMIARNQLGCGYQAEARRLIREAIVASLEQAEPLRSRGLSMLAGLQVKAGDLATAARTVESIRDYPPFEKVTALQTLADGYEAAGDTAAAKRLIRQALACAEAKEPKNAQAHMGKSRRTMTTIASQFIDYEYELEPRWAEHQKAELSVPLRVRLGEVEEAVRRARALPAQQRNFQLTALVRELGQHGDFDGALRLAASLETAEQRLEAIAITAAEIEDRRTTR